MRTARCPHSCPVGWEAYDVVRTPGDLRLMRTLLLAAAILLILLPEAVGLKAPYQLGLFAIAGLLAVAAWAQTAILRALAAHPGHER